MCDVCKNAGPQLSSTCCSLV